MKIKHIRPMQQRLRVSKTLRGAELLRSHAARGNERNDLILAISNHG